MSVQSFSELVLPEVEAALQKTISMAGGPGLDEMHGMLAYHMGWQGEGAGAEARGKRIRPLLVLLCAAGAGGDWRNAVPGGAAVELIHNFSLVHDDIQDESPTRRGRATVWSIWGVAQALNAGDTLFSLAQISLLDMAERVSPEAALIASRTLHHACLELTKGQYLDLSYEGRRDLGVEDYWPMVKGKTAALICTSTYIGALAAKADERTCAEYQDFGENLGLAFQVLDDILGIWGDATRLGKSTASDLVSGKKSLPVLFGLDRGGLFAERWMGGEIQPEEVPALAAELEVEGGRQYAQEHADRLTKLALEALDRAKPVGEAGEALHELADILLKRQK